LLHEAIFHDDDAIAHGHRFNLIVRDVHNRVFDALVDAQKLGAGARAHLRIEIR